MSNLELEVWGAQNCNGRWPHDSGCCSVTVSLQIVIQIVIRLTKSLVASIIVSIAQRARRDLAFTAPRPRYSPFAVTRTPSTSFPQSTHHNSFSAIIQHPRSPCALPLTNFHQSHHAVHPALYRAETSCLRMCDLTTSPRTRIPMDHADGGSSYRACFTGSVIVSQIDEAQPRSPHD